MNTKYENANTRHENAQSQYETTFNHKIIPTNMTGQKYPHAITTVFDSTGNNTLENIIVLDSRYRNWDNETASNYQIYLGQTFDYVQSIELIDGSVYRSNYVVDQSHYSITFKEHHDLITINVPEGVYEIDALCEQISQLMTSNSVNGYTYLCFRDQLTDHIVIQTSDSSHHFELYWSGNTEIIEDGGNMETSVIDPHTQKRVMQRVSVGKTRNTYIQGSLGEILGFLPINLTGYYQYLGQNVYDLYPDKYLALHINTENHDTCNHVFGHTLSKGLNGALAVLDVSQHIQSNSGTTGVYNTQYTPRKRYTKYFNPPIKFNKLHVEIKKTNGDYYDFHGLDHFLIIAIQRVYNREVLSDVNRIF